MRNALMRMLCCSKVESGRQAYSADCQSIVRYRTRIAACNVSTSAERSSDLLEPSPQPPRNAAGPLVSERPDHQYQGILGTHVKRYSTCDLGFTPIWPLAGRKPVRATKETRSAAPNADTCRATVRRTRKTLGIGTTGPVISVRGGGPLPRPSAHPEPGVGTDESRRTLRTYLVEVVVTCWRRPRSNSRTSFSGARMAATMSVGSRGLPAMYSKPRCRGAASRAPRIPSTDDRAGPSIVVCRAVSTPLRQPDSAFTVATPRW